jgi:hypothetical protein
VKDSLEYFRTHGTGGLLNLAGASGQSPNDPTSATWTCYAADRQATKARAPY